MVPPPHIPTRPFDRSRVAFQPIFGPEGRVHGLEALMRFFPAGLANESPDSALSTESVFEAARREGRIMELDFYCRQQAMAEIAEQSFAGLLFLNINPASLLNESHSVGRTDDLAERYGIPKERIVLEITEETAIQDYALFARTVEHYRDQGYRIAIDDFGSGYAGLKMLASIRPDYLKIDRYFVSEIHREPVKHSIVSALVRICDSLGIHLVAEGIESGSEFHSILNLGVEFRQGYYFCHPVFQLSDIPGCIPEEVSHEV